MRALREYAWPGNVRELFAVVESAAIRARGGEIGLEHLPPEVRGDDRRADDALPYRFEGDPDAERAAIVAALESCGGVRSRAADLLGMSRTTLWRRMREFDLI